MKQQNFFTLPNIITLIRLCLAPVLFWVILKDELWIAAIIFAVILLTDWLDGFIARKMNLQSRTGVILDATSDVVVMASAILGLYLINLFPFSWVVILLALAVICFIFQLIAKLRQKDLLYKSLPVAKLSAGALYILLVMFFLNLPMIYLLPMFIIVLVLTILRIYVYFRRML